MTDDNKPTSAQVEAANGLVSQDTLDKLASLDEDIRNSGKLDIFQQVLPKIPADYVFKPRDKKWFLHASNAVFDLIGGVERYALWAHQNPSEYYKLRSRMDAEAEKGVQGPAVVQIISNVPESPLSSGQIIDLDDEESEDADQ